MVARRSTRLLAAAMLSASLLVGGGAAPVSAAKTYRNCTALNKVHPHGVGKPKARDLISGKYIPGRSVTNFTKNRKLYLANKSKDRDGDGVACEQR